MLLSSGMLLLAFLAASTNTAEATFFKQSSLSSPNPFASSFWRNSLSSPQSQVRGSLRELRLGSLVSLLIEELQECKCNINRKEHSANAALQFAGLINGTKFQDTRNVSTKGQYLYDVHAGGVREVAWV